MGPRIGLSKISGPEAAMSATDYLRLVRIHTSAETQALMLIGYLAAGGSDLATAALWLVYGVVAHAWGFLQNNIFDYEQDKQDPSKQHFPLVSGRISYGQAWAIDVLLAIGMSVLVVVQAWKAPLAWPMGLFLLLSMVFGTAYNMWSKKSLTGPLWISLAFTSLPPISYFSVTSTVSPLLVLICLYVFFTIFWQIAYSGYLKDVESDKVNLLRLLGVRAGREIHSTWKSELFGYAMRVPTLLIGFTLVVLYTGLWWVVEGYLLVSAALIIMVTRLVSLDGEWDHHKAVMQMAVVEILVYYGLVFALGGVISWNWLVFLLAYPLAWYVVLNRLTWGTSLTPRV